MSSTLDTGKLAEMLRSKRGSRGLRVVAEEIGGVSASTLSRIEQGNVPDIDTFMRLCDWLEVSPEFFTNAPKATKPTSSILAAHLRADRTLPPETAEALIRMIALAYESVNGTAKRQRV